MMKLQEKTEERRYFLEAINNTKRTFDCVFEVSEDSENKL
jgi:hypothetical protein